MRTVSRRLPLCALAAVTGCGFGVGSFHNKPRSATFSDGPVAGKPGYEYYHQESWEDLTGTYNVHLGYKVGASFASAPGRDVAMGRANEVALETRFGRYGLLLGWSEDKATYDDVVVAYNAFFIGGRFLLTPPSPLMLDLNIGIAQGEACTYKPDDLGCISTGDDVAFRGGLGANIYFYASDTMDVFARVEGRVTATEKAPGLADERFKSVALLTELGFQF
jgi:hypothetical protein